MCNTTTHCVSILPQASIVQQCSTRTALTVLSTTTYSGRVEFKVANLGAQACSSQVYKLAFLVTN